MTTQRGQNLQKVAKLTVLGIVERYFRYKAVRVSVKYLFWYLSPLIWTNCFFPGVSWDARSLKKKDSTSFLSWRWETLVALEICTNLVFIFPRRQHSIKRQDFFEVIQKFVLFKNSPLYYFRKKIFSVVNRFPSFLQELWISFSSTAPLNNSRLTLLLTNWPFVTADTFDLGLFEEGETVLDFLYERFHSFHIVLCRASTLISSFWFLL